MITLVLEWMGCAFALAGAGLLALNISASRMGWWLFLVADGLWIAFAILTEHHGMLTQQAGFTITSLIGIWRSYPIRDWITKVRAVLGGPRFVDQGDT
jgi:hypothetical protein